MAAKKVESVSLFKDLLQRRVPQFLGGYILGSLAIIQFIDWLVDRYPVSPYLPDFSLAILASLIPTVLILSYFHGKPGRDRWTKMEKIGIPVNLLIAIILLFVVFQNKELGATTKKLTVQDETGQTLERVIPASGFRKSLAFFFFDNESNDPSMNWLQQGIPHMLVFDLYQDLFLDSAQPYQVYHDVKEAGFPEGTGLPLTLKNKIADEINMKYFIAGSINKRDGEYIVKTSIHETARGKLVAETVYQNPDLFKLIDEMSIGTRQSLEIPQGHIEGIKDHPVSEILTSSVEAIKLFIDGQNSIIFDMDWDKSLKLLEQSVKVDPTFALGYQNLRLGYTLTNRSEKAAKAADQLMQHLYRLPERVQLTFKCGYYFDVKQDGEKGFSVAKLWADLYPDDLDAHSVLATLYQQRDQKDDAISEYKIMLELDPGKYELLQTIGSLYKGKGDFPKALKYYITYAERFPNKYDSFEALGKLYQTFGDYEQAKIHYEKASILEPGKISVMLSLARIQHNLGHFKQSLNKIQEALDQSRTTQDSSDVYSSLMSYHLSRGQLKKVLEYLHLHSVIEEKIRPQGYALLTKLGGLGIYVMAGQTDVAFEMIKSIEAQSRAPFDKFIPMGYMNIYYELEDADNLQKAIEGTESLIQMFQIEILRPNVYHAQGKVHELRKEYEQAILMYQKEQEINPTDASIQRRFGRCYREIKNYKKAEEHFNKNIKMEPFNPNTHYGISLLYYEMGEKEKALVHMEKALDIWQDADPEYKHYKKAREKMEEWESIS